VRVAVPPEDSGDSVTVSENEGNLDVPKKEFKMTIVIPGTDSEEHA
jgi:hypothetical protein